MLRSALFILLFLLAPASGMAAADSVRNVEIPDFPSTFAPGAVILLPDGSQSVILQTLPSGDFITDLGMTISPEGLILDGEYKGQAVALDPDAIAPQTSKTAPSEKTSIAPTLPASPPTKPENPLKKVPRKQDGEKRPAPAQAEQKKQPAQAEAGKNKGFTLAELLPLTEIEGKQKNAAPKTVTQKEPEKKPAEPKKAQAQAAPEKPRESPKAPESPKARKAKAGEALRIPPEAQKNGDLSFLEGCWQGTRPEYYSKRVIKECFCFGANGKTGKRRIFDGKKRQCIGGANAKLSSNGVLSVTSSGAACNDGERWGSAEMVCRDSGPRAPCSWLFRDANNGRQSYEIPFVRVESCGR